MQNLVFMIDLDNTILDNDGVKKDIEAKMLQILGERLAARFWFYYEAVRKDIDYIDFFQSVARLREENPVDAGVIDEALDALMEWDFVPRLYPGAIDTVLHLKSLGMPLVVSDGDPVFQPMKIHQCGVTQAVDGRVLIFVHKERFLPAVEARFKAEHYVLIDDKPGILMRSKAALGDRLTTVQAMQGKYARDPKFAVDYAPDIAVENFSDLLSYGSDAFLLKKGAAAGGG